MTTLLYPSSTTYPGTPYPGENAQPISEIFVSDVIRPGLSEGGASYPATSLYPGSSTYPSQNNSTVNAIINKLASDVLAGVVIDTSSGIFQKAADIIILGSDIIAPVISEGGVPYPGQLYPGEELYPSGGGSSINKINETIIVKSSSDAIQAIVLSQPSIFTTATSVDTLLISSNDSGTIHSYLVGSDTLRPESSEQVVIGGFISRVDEVLPLIVENTDLRTSLNSFDLLLAFIDEQRNIVTNDGQLTVDKISSDNIKAIIIDLGSAREPRPYLVKTWNGTSWRNGQIKVWNGEVWDQPVVKRWDGSQWI